ncbi:MAG: PqqD family protein [Ruminococcaceae bacterium]|nr:PqqD family protein [Oscillospiraceae bacterium]
MKIKDGYLLRSVAGKNIVVSVGGNLDFNGMLTLNDTGVFFWNLLQKSTTKEEMLNAVLFEYDVDKEEAKKDIDEFIMKLEDAKLLED